MGKQTDFKSQQPETLLVRQLADSGVVCSLVLDAVALFLRDQAHNL